MNLKSITMAVIALVVSLGSCQNVKTTMEKKETAVIDSIMSRRSIRQYKDTPVPRELLQQIAECGVYAPNALNKQEWEVRIVDDAKYLDEVTELMKADMPGFVKSDAPGFRNAFRNATAIIAVACPDDPMGMTLLNVGLMGENMCLAAQDLGLGTCVMAGPSMFLTTNPKAKPYLDKLGFSEGYKLRYVLGVGYPDEAPEAKPRDLSKIKFVEKF
ncbi:MAG: nitroreductase family protein [Bacteroidaceae bacterium]|nr:nitroreductase family protein [Bacteroidaceae bacterium]